MRATWHGLTLTGEALRNLTSRPSRAVAMFLLMLILFTFAGALDLSTAESVKSRVRSLRAQGSTTVRVSAQGEAQGVSAAACNRLNGQVGVVAAGGVGTTTTMFASSSPGLGFLVADSVGDIASALGAPETAVTRPGLLVSVDLAGDLGVTAGSNLVVNGRTDSVARVADLGSRDQTMGRIALIPVAPTSMVASCYVQFSDGAFASGLNTISQEFPSTSSLQITTVYPSPSGAAGPAETWSDRTTRFAWAAIGLIAGAAYLMVSKSRRHEYAVYLLSGGERSAVAALCLVEAQFLALPALLVAGVWLAFIARVTDGALEAFRAGLVPMAETYLVALAAAPIGCIWLLRSNLTTVLKERIS